MLPRKRAARPHKLWSARHETSGSAPLRGSADFIGPQHHRQLLRLTRIRDPLRQIRLPERYPVQKTKRADRLVQRRPRYPASNQMNLKGPDVLQTKLVRRAAEEAAELGNRMHIRSLGRRRQIADCHILDHAPTQRAHLGHRGLPFQGWGEAPKPWQTERLEHPATAHRFPPQRVSSIPTWTQNQK